jgi:hypothetical protein
MTRSIDSQDMIGATVMDPTAVCEPFETAGPWLHIYKVIFDDFECTTPTPLAFSLE